MREYLREHWKMIVVIVVLLALTVLVFFLSQNTSSLPFNPNPQVTATATGENCKKPTDITLYEGQKDPYEVFCLQKSKYLLVENIPGGVHFRYIGSLLDGPVQNVVWVPGDWKLEGTQFTIDKSQSVYRSSQWPFGCNTSQVPPTYGAKYYGTLARLNVLEGTLIYNSYEDRCPSNSAYGIAEQVRKLGNCPDVDTIVPLQKWLVLSSSDGLKVYITVPSYLPQGYKAQRDGADIVIKEDDANREMPAGTGWIITPCNAGASPTPSASPNATPSTEATPQQ